MNSYWETPALWSSYTVWCNNTANGVISHEQGPWNESCDREGFVFRLHAVPLLSWQALVSILMFLFFLSLLLWFRFAVLFHWLDLKGVWSFQCYCQSPRLFFWKLTSQIYSAEAVSLDNIIKVISNDFIVTILKSVVSLSLEVQLPNNSLFTLCFP